MNDFQTIVDRVEIEALRGEITDAVMQRDWDRVASLVTPDCALRMPGADLAFESREEIREAIERLQGNWEFFVQNTHAGWIRIDGDTAVGRAYIQELGRFRDGSSHQNYAIYHDRYQRTPDGWKFSERVYEIRYVDSSPLLGTAHRRDQS